MTTRLHDLLDVASRDAPDRVVGAELARTAWVSGRRRRRARHRRALALTVAAACVAATASAGLGALRAVSGPTPAARPGSVATYPQRIDRPISTDPLPSRPGPLVGLAERYLPKTEESQWTGVTTAGLRWLIATVWAPSLSPDGRWLVTLDAQDHGLDVHDLVAGTHRPVTGIQPPANQQTFLEAWSPDSSTLVLRTPRDAGRLTYHLLDVATGRATPGPAVRGSVVGVAADGTVTTLRTTARATRTTGPTGAITRTDASGRLLRSVPLRPRPEFSPQVTLWAQAAVASPDGSLVAIVDPGEGVRDGAWKNAHIVLFGTATGRQVARRSVDDLAGNNTYSISWVDDDPVVSTRVGPTAVSSVRAGAVSTRLIAIDPALHVTRVQWATQALQGSPVPARFGTAQTWWSWQPGRLRRVAWALVLLAGLTAALVVAVAVRRPRVRHDR